MKIIEYKFIHSGDDINEMVNKEIKNGWQPFGSPVIVRIANIVTIWQAMVKYENLYSMPESPF